MPTQAAFDILQLKNVNEVYWIQAVSTFAEARTRVNELMANSPSKYLIYDQLNGERLLVEPDDLPGNITRPAVA